MLSNQRAHHLAKASEAFCHLLGSFSANDLIDWLSHELGHPEALDDFHQVADILTKAIPPRHLLHIISGNTPHAGLQSLLRGLLIGAKNTLKLPSSPLPELHDFYDRLPNELQQLVNFSWKLDQQTIESADCIIAIGSDQAICAIHAQLSPQQRFIPHGHKISFALIDRPNLKNATLAAIDASRFEQSGCLSPHAIYVKHDPAAFAPMLAKAMEAYTKKEPRAEESLSQQGAIRNLRETVRYQSARQPNDFQLYESSSDTSWTVIYENDSTLKPSPLGRTIYVRPWPKTNEQLQQILGSEVLHLSTIALSPLPALLAEVESLQPPRICALGRAQSPSLFWHHDGFAPLASLVTLRDIHL